MPSDTTTLRFAIAESCHGMTTLTPNPHEPDLHSLQGTTRWINQMGIPLHPCAFFTIEILKSQYARKASNVQQKLDVMFPGLFASLLKKYALNLVQKLIEHPDANGHDDVIEELKFHIFELPNSAPRITPGTYVEVSHGDNIADNIAWWQETSDGLPGTIFGHISIEIYKETLLPEMIELIEKHCHGSPEDLEALVSDDITSLFRHITRQ